MASGQIEIPTMRFPVEDYAAAIAELATGHVRGKVVITLAPRH